MTQPIDLSQPLSTVLRDGTSEAHQSIENSAGAGWLTRAELDKEEYARYLMMLWHIYDTFERALELHATYPTLQPTYNPTLLARAPSLAADIAYILQVPESSWKAHPIHASLIASPPDILTKYTTCLETISNSGDPSPLLAHSYVRYLGDLSGGQMIRRRTAKSYGFDEDTGYGISFYNFKELGGNKPATQGDMKKIKEWFRDGMNAGAGDNKQLKAAILEEAKNSFNLNAELFNSLNPPTMKPSIKKDNQVLQDVMAPAAEPKSYAFTSFLAFLLALCTAHFVLVVGGFTGARGYGKLLAFEEWITTTWNNVSGAVSNAPSS